MRADDETVVGIFEDRQVAGRAINVLRDAGFADDDIGYLSRDGYGDTMSGEPGGQGGGAGVVGGALAGAGIGGLAAAAASLLIPGFGPVLAGGFLATTLGGAALGAATGGMIGALVEVGVPEEEARYYEGELTANRLLVTVQAGDRSLEAREIIRQCGGRYREPGAATAA